MRLGDGKAESVWVSHLLMAFCVLGVWVICFWYGLTDIAKNYRGRCSCRMNHLRELGILVCTAGLCVSAFQVIRVAMNDTIALGGYWLISHQIVQMVVGGMLASIYVGAMKRRWLYMMEGLKDLGRNFSETTYLPIHILLQPPNELLPIHLPQPSPSPPPPSNELLPSYGPIHVGKKPRSPCSTPYSRGVAARRC